MSLLFQIYKIIFASQFKVFHYLRAILLIVFAFLIMLSFSVVSSAQEEDEEQTEAVLIFNKGQDAHEKGDLQTALKFYDEAIKLAPKFPEAEFQRGNALLTLGKSDEAEQAFRRAIELREDWTLPMASLGGLLIQKNNFAEAETVLSKAVELDAQNFPAYVALTELRLKQKAAPVVLKELLTKLQNLTAKANPTASIWAARGAIESALSDKIAAKKSLTNALAIEPKNSFALTTRTEISLAEGDFARATNEAKMLLQISPNSTGAKILLARVYAESGNRTEALKILDAIEATDSNAAALRNSITAVDSVNAADLEKQLEKNQKNAAILGRLCVLLRTENPSRALDYCRRASEAELTNVNHAVGFGAALVQAKQFENAIIIFRKILQIAPDNFTAHANLATALFQSKHYAEAKTEYQWLTEKQPNLAIAYYFLAITHDNLGEYWDSMANYQQFLKIADATENKLEIEKVNLRLPTLQKQLKKVKSKK
ncbi:MAG: tetratricopeptide repeat protein [Acidobacteriota bacterium]|nr:tetratricopeptide repeat protein [Acidobacteriota bacterium]